MRDTKLNSGEAATRTLELIEKDKVNFVVGSLSAATQLSINAVPRAQGAVQQHQPVRHHQRGQGLEPLHLPRGAEPAPDRRRGRALRVPKFGKKVVYLTADYAYGHEMVRGFERAGKPLGVQTLADIRHPLGTADYSAFLPRIQSLKPDVLVLCNFGRDLVNSAKQATDFGIKQTPRSSRRCCSTPRGWPAAPTRSTASSAAPRTTGAWKTGPDREGFNDKFRKAYDGAVPSDYGALGYAGVRSVLQAVKNATRPTRSERRAAPAEVRLVQGAAVLPQVRPPVGAVGHLSRASRRT